MDDLGGALRQLAGTAAAPGVGDPAGLWKQGRARVRRRRVTAAVALAVVVVAGYAVVVRPEPTVVMPTGRAHAPAIPKNIYQPSKFLAGVSEEGPPGQLAVIAEKPGDEDRDGPWFGISATTGEYRYLDLPHIADDTAMALSADGRRIAYWVTGPTKKSSFGKGDGANVGGPLPDRPTTGVAVYDTTKGTIVEHQMLTDYGIRPDDGPQGGLAWLADDSLAFTYGEAVGSNMTRFTETYRWSPIGSEPVLIADGGEYESFFAPALPGDGWITSSGGMNDGEGGIFVDARGNKTGRTFSIETMGSNGDGRLTVNAGRVVGVGVGLIDETQSDSGTTSSLGAAALSVGLLPPNGGKVDLRPVGSIVNTRFLGWLSTTQVLVTGTPGQKPNPEYFEPGDVPGPGALYPKEGANGDFIEGTWMYDVDVVTGRTRRLGVVDSDLLPIVVASDLLGEQMVDGRHPPSWFDALRTWIVSGGALVLALAAWWYIRPKRRAWRAYLERERGDDA